MIGPSLQAMLITAGVGVVVYLVTKSKGLVQFDGCFWLNPLNCGVVVRV